MSAQLDTERVTRAMLAVAAKSARPKRAARRKCRWTQAEVDVLAREWGVVSERKLRARLPGRTWDGIARKAYDLELGPPSQGKASIGAIVARSNLTRPVVMRALAERGVQVTLRVRRFGVENPHPKFRRRCVSPDEALAEIDAWLTAQHGRYCASEAARELGVGHMTLLRAVRALAAVRPIEGVREGKHWRITLADARAALAHRSAATAEGPFGRTACGRFR